MTELLLYNHPYSSNALKVRFALAELELPYETRHVPLEQPRPDWYLAVNPFGRVPTLVDGDLVLPESNAIIRYLVAREGRDDLYPSDLRRRARIDHAVDAWATLVRPALFPLEKAALFFPGATDRQGGPWEKGDQEAIAAAKPGAEQMLDAFERITAGNGTVVGEFSIAELVVGPVLWRASRLPLDFGRWPGLSALLAAIEQSPSFQAAEPVR
jgi:glutathione S-transferase